MKKILIHFRANQVDFYKLENGKVNYLYTEIIYFNETLVNYELLKKIDKVIAISRNFSKKIDNINTRIYATEIFQDFSLQEQEQLRIYIYVKFGLFLNILNKELIECYKNKNLIYTELDFMQNLVNNEFRKVVICGSFQEHFTQISSLINEFKKRNVEILSPWTTEVVQETLGTDFILLQGQELYNERDSWRHKYDHMNKFKKADAIIVCNPDGRIGKGTMFEFGYMIANNKRIIFTNPPFNLSIHFPYEIGLNFL